MARKSDNPHQTPSPDEPGPRVPLSEDAAVIRFDGVTIAFPIYSAHGRSLKRSMMSMTTGGRIGLSHHDRAAVTALDDVSLMIRHGERVGLVGHNGAGKSTILRAIAGVYEPQAGAIETTGRIGSLLDVTLGMDMEATGYENIAIRALLLGLSRAETAELVSEVEQVTELGDFLSVPVRTYSSGMLLRLAFSISTAVVPDILLMDEWLSVGDAQFVEKTQARLRSLIDRSRALVIASHSLDLLCDVCTRVLWLEHGRIRADGRPVDVIEEYRAAVSTPTPSAPVSAVA